MDKLQSLGRIFDSVHLMQTDNDWSASVKKRGTHGCTMEVRSAYGHATPEAAVDDLYERVRAHTNTNTLPVLA